MKNNEKQLISFPQNLLFHFLSKHCAQLLEFRLWFIARYFLDYKKCGLCDMTELAKFANIKSDTLIKKLRHSKLFRGYSKTKVYYTSLLKITKLQHLRKRTKFRTEYPSKQYISIFRNQQKFKAYIIKCYFENDLRKKSHQFTYGRISNDRAAKVFGISKRTIQRLIKLSEATSEINIREFKNIKVNIKHKKQLGNWLLNHAEDRIDGCVIGNNFASYFVRFKTPGEYYLCQRLPNIFHFTGVRLAIGIIRGNSLPPSSICKKNACR